MDYMKTNKEDVYTDLCSLLTTADIIPPLLTRVNTPEVLDLVSTFLETKKQDKNFAFLWTYMDMVQVLLTFTRA